MIDSLMYHWGQFERLYAFPPFAIVHLVIQKFIEDKSEGILIVPYWKTKPWFTVFANLIVAKPVLIHVTNDVLSLPFDSFHQEDTVKRLHPLNDKLKLVAALCSCKPAKLEAFRRQLPKRWDKEDERHHLSCMDRIYLNGNAIVSKGVLIPFVHL